MVRTHELRENTVSLSQSKHSPSKYPEMLSQMQLALMFYPPNKRPLQVCLAGVENVKNHMLKGKPHGSQVRGVRSRWERVRIRSHMRSSGWNEVKSKFSKVDLANLLM